MSEAQPPGSDLIPGMVTVVEQSGAVVHSDTTVLQALPAQPDHFDVVLRGYERHQVDRHVYAMAVLVEQLRQELADTADREATSAAELVRIRGEYERGKPSFDALGDRVSQMLGLAEREAAQLRSDAEQDAVALRRAAEREAADSRSDASREAEELGAAARREVAELTQQRVALLTEIAAVRDTLNAVLAGTPEQWPSLAPTDEPAAVEATEDPGAPAAPDLDQTLAIDLTHKPSNTRG